MHASRRDFLRSSGMGFGSIALAGLLARDGVTGSLPTHFPARAKRVIHVFLNGGMSQVDTFDPKPELAAEIPWQRLAHVLLAANEFHFVD